MSFITNGLIKFEEYEVDSARWQLRWREDPITLNRKTFDLLLYLAENADRVVGKEELLRTLWPESFVEESNLTQHIFLLRRALSRHDSGLKIIETVPGRGYRFAATVKEQQPAQDRMVITASESITRVTFEEEEESPDLPLTALAQSLPISAPGKRRLYLVGGSLIAATVLGVAGWFGWQRWLDRTTGPPVELVLTAMDGTTGDTVLDGALVDALRIDLAQSPFVSVVSSARARATLTQMMHKPDEPMTPALAREVCERTNSQAILHGTIARDGKHFLITEEATNCVDGSVLAETKHEAATAEDLPSAIDALAESLRKRLGESRRSLSRFNNPLFPMSTVSLDALKDYSQAEHESEQGKMSDAIGLLKKAVLADPSFGAAYYDLTADYESTADFSDARAAILKAYDLRDSATEPIRLAITALYNSLTTEDLFESERNYRNWTELYPRSPAAWNGLYFIQRELGKHAEAVVSGKRALALRPAIQGLYVNLADEQLRANDPKAALATCDQAIAKNLDGDRVRDSLMQIAYFLHDDALMQTQRTWAAAHPQEALFSLVLEVEIAAAEGRFSDSRRLLAQGIERFRQQGLATTADRFLWVEGLNLIESGDVDEGTKLFHSVPGDPEDGLYLLGLVYTGNLPAASTGLHAMQTKYPSGTLWNLLYGPRVNAGIALAAHNPKGAITLLEAARPLDQRDPVVQRLRGDVYLAAGQPIDAEREYRNVIAHPEINPITADIPLSWLGLARALAAQGKHAAAADAYQQFLTLWVHADPDVPYLKQARQELAALQTAAPPN